MIFLYHFVCPANYRRIVFCADVDESLKKIFIEILKRYDIVFIETGKDQDDVTLSTLTRMIASGSFEAFNLIVGNIEVETVFSVFWSAIAAYDNGKKSKNFFINGNLSNFSNFSH